MGPNSEGCEGVVVNCDLVTITFLHKGSYNFFLVSKPVADAYLCFFVQIAIHKKREFSYNSIIVLV